MSLFSKVKTLLPDCKSVISDNESILLNRKDYHITQISPVHASMSALHADIGYPYRVLLGLLDSLVAGLASTELNVVLTDPSLTLAAYQCWLRSGGEVGKVRVYAPRGLATLPAADGFMGELLEDFRKATVVSPDGKPDSIRKKLFTIVIGNTKSSEQTMFAVDRFNESTCGVLILKDYARIDAFDEREYLESKLIFLTQTYEGHGLAFKFQ